jgi:hypothetical protein
MEGGDGQLGREINLSALVFVHKKMIPADIAEKLSLSFCVSTKDAA